MDYLKEIIARQIESRPGRFVIYLVSITLSIALSIVLLVSSYAVLEGREVSIWPFKISQRPCDNIQLSCHKNIGLNIISPKDNAIVNNPFEINGTISHHAESFLWLTAYHEVSKTYTDLKQIVPDENNSWRQKVNLVGGAAGDSYIIDLFSVGEDGNKKLMQLRNTHSPALPEELFGGKYSRCRQINVRWQ